MYTLSSCYVQHEVPLIYTCRNPVAFCGLLCADLQLSDYHNATSS